MLAWIRTTQVFSRKWAFLQCALIAFCALMISYSQAQETSPETAVTLPDTDEWLQRIAGQQTNALLGSVALGRLLESLEAAPDADVQTVIDRVSTDMVRLRSLAAHYENLPIIFPLAGEKLVDAVSTAELSQQGMQLWQGSDTAVEPRLAGLAVDALLAGDDELAVAWLAPALAYSTIRAGLTWSEFTQLSKTRPGLVQSALVQLQLPSNSPAALTQANQGVSDLEALVEAMINDQPVNEAELNRVRYSILRQATDMPEAMPRWRRQLAMAELAGSKHSPLQKLHGLLELQQEFSRLSQDAGNDVDLQRFEGLKEVLIPGLSRQLSEIDPELLPLVNRLRALTQQPTDLDELLLDARTMLALGVEDASFYFSQPVRSELAEEIDVCLSIAGNIDETGSSQMTAAQFRACLDAYLDLLVDDASSAELSGDPDGPFGAQTLRRELSLVVWQRINYLRGYVDEALTAACSLNPERLPNPLEWAFLASQFRWLADFLPEYFNSQGERMRNMQRLDDMISLGRRLSTALSQQVDCATGEGTGNRDPMNRALARYRETLEELRRQIAEVKAEFELQRLRPGADIRLADGPGQATGYRPAEQMIEPCDAEQVCEMSSPLPASRALFGLFPSEFLVAHQSGLGEVSLCYDEVSWLDRERKTPRSRDQRMAIYTGRLGLVLKGRYRETTGTDTGNGVGGSDLEDDESVEVFAYQLESPDRHEYLFAPNRDEILDDACPTEWVGEKLVAELPERRWHIVPNRLTFLAGARTLPSRLIAENWDRGAEWRDWFINANNTQQIHSLDGDAVTPSLERHLAALAIANESAIYRALLGNQANAASAALAELSSAALMVRKVAELFYPQQYATGSELRRYLTGDDRLLDRSGLRRLQNQQVPVSNILPLAEQRIGGLEALWAQQAQSLRAAGSLPGFVSRSLLQLLDLRQRTEAASPGLSVTPPQEPVLEPTTGDSGSISG